MNVTHGSPQLRRWPLLLLVASALLTYSGSLFAPFVFDDIPAILGDRSIHELWRLERVLAHTTRPLLKLSLALNHALGEENPVGYRLVNIAIHALAGLTLYGILRRTLLSSRLHGRYASSAAPVALSASLLWLLHPLHTESVTYVYQRAESLAGLFVLLSLYALIRLASSRRRVLWGFAVVSACVLGLATKEVAVVAPLVLLLYDRCFLGGSLRTALRARTSIYASLALIWLLLLLLFFGEALFLEGSSAGFGVREITPLQYAASQPQVILHYLRLAVWPHPLCLDYGWPAAQGTLEIVLPGAALLALLLVGLRLLQRHNALGFLALSFFIVLLPSSSILPIRDLAAEHRMYLPLIPVVLLAVLAAAALLERIGAGRGWVPRALVAALAVVLASATVMRNGDYRDAVTTWTRVVECAPENPRGHLNLGLAHQQLDELEPALACYREALILKPDYAEVRNNLGALLLRRGESMEALHHLRAALASDPRHTPAHVNIARVLLSLERAEEAVWHLRRAVEIDPFDPTPHHSLGVALWHVGSLDEATAELERALELDPGYEQARLQLEDLRRLRPD